MNLDELSTALSNLELPKTLQLTPHEKIVDVEKFVSNHISVLKNNSGKVRFKPYYDRLLKVYQLCKKY